MSKSVRREHPQGIEGREAATQLRPEETAILARMCACMRVCAWLHVVWRVLLRYAWTSISYACTLLSGYPQPKNSVCVCVSMRSYAHM